MDVPFNRQPNCIGSILSLTSSINHETTKSSKTLERKGVSEIGLTSLSHVGFVILGIGMILDSSHEIGITPDDKDTLIVTAGVASSKANSLKILLGILSDPWVLLG